MYFFFSLHRKPAQGLADGMAEERMHYAFLKKICGVLHVRMSVHPHAYLVPKG